MKSVLALAVVFVVAGVNLGADVNAKLECYQCSNVALECDVDGATVIRCPNPNAKCVRRFKTGATDKLKAIRMCGLPDVTTNLVNCPPGYECEACALNKCNGAIGDKGAAPAAATMTWVGWIVVTLTALYI